MALNSSFARALIGWIKSLPVPRTVPFRVVKGKKIGWVWFGKQFQPIQAKHSSERYRSKLILKLIRTKLITFKVDMYVGLLLKIVMSPIFLKVQVVDVVSRDRCVCQTEEGRLLEGG